MLRYKLFFVLLLVSVIHSRTFAQDIKVSDRNMILGLWELRPGIQYFFDPNGSGFMFLGDDSIPAATFNYTIDSTAQRLYRVHLHFSDSVTAETCFIYEPGEKNQLFVYARADNRYCPEKITEPDLRQVIWTRPSYEGK